MNCAIIFRLSILVIVINNFKFSYSIPLNGKVMGGQIVLPGVVKYMVSYRHNMIHKCTGFLITLDSVLIAASCFHEFLIHVIIPNFNNYSIVTGISNDFYHEGKHHRINQMLTHKSYEFKDTKPYHNIGLIQLMKNIELSDNADCSLRTGYTLPVGEIGHVMAWGAYRETEFSQELTALKNITLQVKIKQFCQLRNRGNLICAAPVTPSDTFNPEDLGAPLTHNLSVVGILVKILPINNALLYISLSRASPDIIEMEERLNHRVVNKLPRRRITFQQYEEQRQDMALRQ